MCGSARELLLVYLMSLAPVMEGRYAVVAGIAMGIPIRCAVLAAAGGVVSLSIALPLLMPLADILASRLERSGASIISRLARLYLEYSERARRRAKRYIDRYGVPGLILFVAIPFPATGIWTGAIGAHLLGMNRGRMMLSLLIGGLASLALMTLAGGIVG